MASTDAGGFGPGNLIARVFGFQSVKFGNDSLIAPFGESVATVTTVG